MPKNEQITKTTIGFCNMHGGRLIIGIADNGEIIGIEESIVEETLEYLHKMIYECCTPPVMPDIYTQRVDGRLLITIRVSPGGNKPYFIRALGVEKGTFIRLGRSTMLADPATIADLQRHSRGVSYDRTAAYGAKTEDIHRPAVALFLKNRIHDVTLNADDTHLLSYHLILEEQTRLYPTIAGILLFAKRPQEWFPEHFIICTQFKGVCGREVIAALDCNGTLFEQFESAYGFCIQHLEKSYSIVRKRRVERLEIPAIALREMILNALVHRNYAVSGPIKIALFDDRIEIFSPGVFPGPLDSNNLTSGITYIRNTAIARVFREAQLIEKLGSGFITLFDSYRQWGLNRPIVIEGTNFIKCILPRTKQVQENSGHENEILQLFLLNPELKISTVIDKLHISRATAGRHLAALEAGGRIRRTGNGAGTRYRTV